MHEVLEEGRNEPRKADIFNEDVVFNDVDQDIHQVADECDFDFGKSIFLAFLAKLVFHLVLLKLCEFVVFGDEEGEYDALSLLLLNVISQMSVELLGDLLVEDLGVVDGVQ